MEKSAGGIVPAGNEVEKITGLTSRKGLNDNGL